MDREPLVVHYHGRITGAGLLEASGHALVDRAIGRANRAIEATFRQGGFVNEIFWDTRYALDPELGSGLGSRSELRELKAALLQGFVDAVGVTSMLDLGCGDIETTRELRVPDYVGVDTSAEALAIASAKRPDWRFTDAIPADRRRPTDLVTCLDVLIHQPDRASYRALLSAALDATDDWVIVSGYERPPRSRSAIVFFHEPLGESVLDLAPEASIIELAEYRDTTMLAVRPRDPRAHPRHVSPAVLNAARDAASPGRRSSSRSRSQSGPSGSFPIICHACSSTPGSLRWRPACSNRGRPCSTWAPVSHPSRCTSTPSGSRSPRSTRARSTAPARIPRTWDEWGYLDYAHISPRVRSFNTTMEELPRGADVRDDLLGERHRAPHGLGSPGPARRGAPSARSRGAPAADRRHHHGLAQLWNMNAGEIVDTTEPHGTFCDLLEEVRSAGFEIVDVGSERDLGLHVELGCIVARR